MTVLTKRKKFGIYFHYLLKFCVEAIQPIVALPPLFLFVEPLAKKYSANLFRKWNSGVNAALQERTTFFWVRKVSDLSEFRLNLSDFSKCTYVTEILFKIVAFCWTTGLIIFCQLELWWYWINSAVKCRFTRKGSFYLSENLHILSEIRVNLSDSRVLSKIILLMMDFVHILGWKPHI